MNKNMINRIDDIKSNNDFSGTILVQDDKEIIAEINYGYANRSEQLINNTLTRYGIASGCKIFTAIAICQLVEERKLSYDTKLNQCLDFKFLNFDEEITINIFCLV